MNYTIIAIFLIGIIALLATTWKPNFVATLFSFFGHSPINMLQRSLDISPHLMNFMAPAHPERSPKGEPPPWLNPVVRIVVTVILLIACLYVILFGQYYDEGTRSWSYGTIGAIVGFWLKSPT